MALKKLFEIPCSRGVIFRTGFSHDGKILSSSHQNGCVIFWDAETGQKIGEHTEHNKITVRCSAWNPVDFRIASGDTDGHIVIWNFETGESSRINKAHQSRVRTISWSPDGTKLLSGSSDGYVKTWEAKTGNLISVSNNSEQNQAARPTIYSAKWSPCGKYLASCLGNQSIIWDAISYQEIKILEGHIDKVRSVTWSKDGKLLASCSNDGSYIIWDTETWVKLSSQSIRTSDSPKDASIFCVHFSPNQKFIVTKSTDNAVRIWRLIDSKCIVKIEELCGNGLGENLGGLAFHPSLPLLVTLRNECQHLRVWELDYETLDQTNTYFDIDEGSQSSIINNYLVIPEIEQALIAILSYTDYPHIVQ